MIDLHCHLLPAFDDGAENTEEALDMARIAQENGIQTIVVSPHLAHLPETQRFYRARDAGLARLRRLLAAQGLELELLSGAEVLVDEDIFYAGDLHPACLAQTRFLLVEFGFAPLRPAKLLEYLDEISNRGMIPVVAHPERYSFFQQNYNLVNALCEDGVLFQINAGSLAGLGGPAAQALAAGMVRLQLAQFLATDAHGAFRRSPAFRAMRKRFPAQISREQLHFMTQTAPAALLRGERPLWEKLGYL
ncbi:MAG: hypothetical protein LBQ33_05975 [Oscillospiraceae bacterium]|jgi:protein-tyrosine phosphatase|nr:hypothetical protein [Oscillospiraceae bacterium]